MRIQHNIMAMNAYRNYNNNVSAMKSNLEKLSSGYKINRAGDDAAGLAISEKMRAQITGLETAQKNAKDGISLVQTAEGALTEVHDMLNRMVELATQSANGTYDNETDRAQLQKEMDQLRAEINRIADSSNFNGINLLDGSMQTGGVGGISYENVSAKDILGLLPDKGVQDQTGVDGDKTVTEADAVTAASASFEISLNGMQKFTAASGDTFILKIGTTAITANLTAGTEYDSKKLADAIKTAVGAAGVSYGGGTFTVDTTGDILKFTSNDKNIDLKTNDTVTWELQDDNGVVSHDLDGQIEGYDVGGGGVVAYANGGSVSTVTGTVAVGSGSAAVDLDSNVSLAQNLTDTLDAAGVSSGNITLQYSGGSWDLKVGGQAVSGLSVSASAASGVLTISNSSGTLLTITAASGGAAEASVVESDFQSAFGTAQTIGTYEAPSDAPDVTTPSTSTPSTSTPTQSTTTQIDFSSAATSLGSLDFTASTSAIDGTQADGLNAVFSATAASGGTPVAAGVSGEVSVDLSGVTATSGDTIQSIAEKVLTEATKAFEAWNTANASSGMMYTNIRVTSDAAGGDILAQAVNGGLYIQADKVARTTNPDPGDAAVSKGTINSGIQNPVSYNAGGSSRVANTVVDFDEVNAWTDGSKIKIGNETYTVAVGADSKFRDTADIVLDEGFSKQEAAQKLAQAAAKNTIFSVGHDGNGKTTLQQIVGQETGKMKTREDIASYLGVKTATIADPSKVKAGSPLTLQIGDTAASYNKLQVDIQDMHCSSLGIDEISIADQESASDAIDAIKKAINQVSDVRGTLGATQNRLDHTINNLSVMTENIQDAESTIRDTDVAEEMMAYTKNNILIQSAQAMLAQANQVPQGVLQLLG